MHQNFLKLSDECYDDVYRYVFFKVNNRWDTDDIVEEILKKAFEKFKTVKGNPRAWLFTIARNIVIDFWRRKKDFTAEYYNPGVSRIVSIASNSKNDMIVFTVLSSEEKGALLRVIAYDRMNGAFRLIDTIKSRDNRVLIEQVINFGLNRQICSIKYYLQNRIKHWEKAYGICSFKW